MIPNALRAWSPLLVLLLVACGGGGGSAHVASPGPVETYTYKVPEDIGDGWAVADLVDEGFDAALMTSMMRRIYDGTFEGIDSVTIARNNKLVLHEQIRRSTDRFDEWIGNVDYRRHVMHSTSKSFTSALIGIAIDQGMISSPQVPFYSMFNYATYDNWDSRKAAMTLEDALTMRLGIEWDEWSLPYTDPRNDLVALENNNLNWVKALLDQPMDSDPGTKFAYNTAATIAIGQALENATGMPMADFANQYLFYPMNITTADWWLTPSGLPNGGSGLFLLPRDMAKFGQLFIDDGIWNGQQLLSPAWIAASVSRHVDLAATSLSSKGYGYQWWIDEFMHGGQAVEAWITSGYGGQYIFCIPALELVVAFTGQNYENPAGIGYLYTMMELYILPAIG